MPSIQFADIDDAVLCTQEHFINKGSFVDMQTDLSDHVAVREMWKKRQKVFSGGHPWSFKAQIDHNHSAKAVGLFETDGTALTDTMISGTVPVRHVNAHYIYDQREPDFQRGGTSIVDLVRTRYVGMMVSLFEKVETYLWGVPDSGDEKTPFGLQYWLLRNTTEGYNGENHANFSSGRANIDSTTYTRWANWSNDYEEITKPDLIRSMRRAHRKIQFRSPVSHATPVLGGMSNGIYTNDAVLGIMEEILEDQNMNLGNDLASKEGKTLFKSTPIIYAPKLDSDTENPIYMLDWKYLAIGVMAGWENNLGKPYMVPNKHLVRRVDLDASLNMICTDLRRQAVFYDPA
ncbi:hypothetical protein LCGC14_1120960 [marine sediment metagenome]|uniref:Bacteriophage Mu GpT domain-containing protein n=1 Tax=marine sediment metagenome TaxID=412755 RepID=A0A0F9M8R6_9ZZZZ